MNGSLLANYIYLQLMGETENYFRSLHNIHVCNYFYINRKTLLPSATKLRRLCFYRCVSVHGGVPGPEGGAWSSGCLVLGECLVPGVPGPWGCLVLGAAPEGVGILACTEADPLERCGRYASYWNTFLLLVVLLVWNESMNLGKEKHITD